MIKSTFKFILYFIFFIILAFNLYVIISGNFFIYKALRYNFVGIDDYKIFDNSTIKASKNPQPWQISEKYNSLILPDTIKQTHKNTQTFAFIIVKEDSIFYEKYWDGYSESSISNSFSMAKSVVSMLIGVAIKEGKIKSENDFVYEYLSEFKAGDKSKIKIKDLLMMSSGLNWDESKSYNNLIAVFFSDIMQAYYGNNLYDLCMKTSVTSAPGVYFDYKSGDTQLLAFILKKATGKSVSQYFEEKIWQPLGAENDALWCLDKANGDEKAFCCLNSNARDFAKLGKLMIQNGKWNEVQIIDSLYLKNALSSKLLHTPEGNFVDYYGYQFWLLPQFKNQNIFYLRGTLGQLIVVVPNKKMIVVRLGNLEGNKIGDHYSQAILYAKMALDM